MKGQGKREASALLAQNLIHWRKHKQIDCKRAAIELGVAVSAWRQWESGARFPSRHILDRLADYMGVPFCSLFSDSPARCRQCAAQCNKE